VFRILSRFYINFNDKIESLSFSSAISSTELLGSITLWKIENTETKWKLFHLKSKCNKTETSLENHCEWKNVIVVNLFKC
jgi:hypothetical protein